MDTKNLLQGLDLNALTTMNTSMVNVNQRFRDAENRIKETQREKARLEKEDRENAKQATQYLKEIRDNVYSMHDVLDVLRINSNQNAELLPLIAEILLISQSSTTSEAIEKTDSILEKIKGFKENIELYEFLHGLTTGVTEYIKMKIKGEV